jgi:hypothetical protein
MVLLLLLLLPPPLLLLLLLLLLRRRRRQRRLHIASAGRAVHLRRKPGGTPASRGRGLRKR